MNALRIAPWVPGTGIDHISTTWEIATDTGFTDIVETVAESIESLTMFYSALALSETVPYYVRTRRHFNDGSASDWFATTTMLATGNVKTIDIKPEVILDTPSIFINLEELTDIASAVFTIKTSACRITGNDAHAKTHWILRNSIGDILYKSLYNDANLTELVITKADIDFVSISKLSVEVAHVSANGFESPFIKGEYNVRNSGFELVTNVSSVAPYLDYEVTIEHDALKAEFPDYIAVVLYDDNKNELWRGENTVGLTLTIPKASLIPEANFILRIYGRDINSTETEFIEKRMYTTNTAKYIIDNDYVYKETQRKLAYPTPVEVRSVFTEQLPNGLILLPHVTDDTLRAYRLVGDELVLENNTVLSEPITFSFFVDIKILENNKIIVHKREHDYYYAALNETLILIFPLLLVYSPFTNMYHVDDVSVSPVMPRLESGASVTHIAAVISMDEVLFINGSQLQIENTTTGIITYLNLPVFDVPVTVDASMAFTYIGNGEVLYVYEGLLDAVSTKIVYKYVIASDEWVRLPNAPSTLPSDFKKFYSTRRKDGKVIFFNISDDPLLYDTQNTILFDPVTGSWSVNDNTFTTTREVSSVVKLLDGRFLRIPYVPTAEAGVQETYIVE